MRRIRIGIFGRSTAPSDGGADTLLRTIEAKLGELRLGETVEIETVPWSAWSHRRRPLRYLWCRAVRAFGGELPLVDLRGLCRRRRLDVAYFAAPAFVRIDIPYVFTLWDLGHRTIPGFPEMRSGRDPWSQREALCRTMLGQASYVVTGNRTGAAEACAFFGLATERVVPVPFPNPDFSGVVEALPAGMPKAPFFLYPAQFWPHKNHHTLVRALGLLDGGPGHPAPHLIFVGANKSNAAYLRSAAAQLGVGERVHFPGFVTRGELKALYARAAGLVFPSLLGPNNLPPQEAAMLGCPMILSDLPGHREQLGDGALFAAPLDAGAWADAMRALWRDNGLRDGLRERARRAVAGCTAETYVSAIGGLLARVVAERALWGEGR